MIWGDATRGDTAELEAVSLTPAELLDLESSAILGVGAATPPVDPNAQGSDLVEVQASSGKTAWRRRLAPHHRGAVQGFFGIAPAKQD